MRAFNRVLSLLLGLALLAGGLLVAAEVAAALLDRGDTVIPTRRWADAAGDHVHRPGRPVVFGVVAAVGLVLFVAEARRWPKQRVPLADDQQRSWWLLRRPGAAPRSRGHHRHRGDRRPGPGTPTAPAATGAPGRRRRPHRQARRRATRRPGA